MTEKADTTATDEVRADSTAEKKLSLEQLQNRIWEAWRAQYPDAGSVRPATVDESYIREMFDEYVVISVGGDHWKVGYTNDGETITFAPRDEWEKVKEERNWVSAKNALKAVSRTEDELRVVNYIVLFDGRDLEGIQPMSTEIAWRNPDGSRGEYFTKGTDLESSYTATGRIHLDYEHGKGKRIDGPDAPGRDDVLGYVDWSTKRVDDRGVWVERAINRHNAYAQWIETLIDAGIVGTSSEAVETDVEKADDGAISRWPLRRDTLTITPMEWRNKTENVVRAFKALGVDLALDNNEAEPEQEQETAPEAAPVESDRLSAVAVARARARLQRIRVSLLEVSK